MTKIEWCDMTVNPVVGCTYGCEYCYARKMNQRFRWIENFEKPQFFPERLKQFKTKEPKVIFINSMSDIADWKTPDMVKTWDAISENPQNMFLALTKRPNQFTPDVYDFKPWNLWIGQTITNQYYANRINPYVDFLSIEPLLGPIKLSLEYTNIKWVIIGAETGNRKGKVIPESKWVADIVKECDKNNIPVFMKGSMAPYFHRYGNHTDWPEFILKRHPEKGQNK